MPANNTAELLTEFQAMLDRLEGDSALRHDLASVNRFEAMASQIGECLGEGAIRLMLAEALYRMANTHDHGQRRRHWVEFINRRRQLLELVIAGRMRRQRSEAVAMAAAKPRLALVNLAKAG